jgi:hypothetical protein
MKYKYLMVYREILNMGHANVYVSMATGQNAHTFYLGKTQPIFFLPKQHFFLSPKSYQNILFNKCRQFKILI